MSEASVFYLLAYPGTGKTTIAREICAATGAELCDAHRWNAPIFREYGVSATRPPPEVARREAEELRSMTVRDLRELPEEEFTGAVFTNKLYEGSDSSPRRFEEVRRLAEERGAPFLTFRLHCDREEVIRRGVNPAREHRSKLVDPSVLDAEMENYTLYDPPHPNVVNMDVTDMSAREAAACILLVRRCMDQAAERGMPLQELTDKVAVRRKHGGLDMESLDAVEAEFREQLSAPRFTARTGNAAGNAAGQGR